MRKSQSQSFSKKRNPKTIRSATDDLASVLKHYGMFQPQEKYKIVCPFHADKNASLQINLDRGTYFCYGCNASGNALSFVLQVEKNKGRDVGPLKALQLIKKWSKSGAKEAIDKEGILCYNDIYNINIPRDYYYNLPTVNWNKKNLLLENFVESKAYLKRRGFTCSMLNDMGARVNPNNYYPIIFPIMDNGIFRGYVMRTMDKEVEQQRKYMYNRGFHRSNVLAGDYGKRCGSDCVVLVEGFMDMVKCKQCGIPNVVAVLGWKISDRQIEKLKSKGVKRLFCALDNDDAGDKGWRYLKTLKGFDVCRVRYPKGVKDFGDVTQEVFKDIIEPQLIRKKFKKGVIKNGTH